MKFLTARYVCRLAFLVAIVGLIAFAFYSLTDQRKRWLKRKYDLLIEDEAMQETWTDNDGRKSFIKIY